MSTPNAFYWHALNVILPTDLWRLLPVARVLGGPEPLFHSNEDRLLQAGLDPSLAKKIISGRIKVDPAIQWEKLQKLGIRIVSIEDSYFPARLREISSPPPLLYVRGNESLLGEKSLGVVGSRKISAYGKDAVKALVPDIVEYGIQVVSGMAFGVDAAALNTSLDCGSTPISVLASSLDYHEISPRAHLQLAERIIQKGCLISENPPGRASHKMLFPLRNRIISGLSLGVIIVEAAPESGSLITARYALEQNREVFAVPGSIFAAGSTGTLDLIKKGAKCVTTFNDIAAEFGWDLKPVQQIMEFDDELHKTICGHLAQAPLGINELIDKTNLAPQDILSAITELELKGVLKRMADGVYAKIK